MAENIELYHSFDAKLATNIGEQSVSSNIQAIIELIKNSYDADALNCKVHFYADGQTGNHIKMTKNVIEDNGIGFPDNKDKLFEPYITHKANGSGLGLAICKKIIEDHNGKIRIEKNKQMAGTTSSIKFENV